MNRFLTVLALIAALVAPALTVQAQPVQPALRPPDIKFTSVTTDTQALIATPVQAPRAGWEQVEILIPDSPSVRPGPGDGHWTCMPGRVDVRLNVPAALRPLVAGVVFQSRWVDSDIQSPITFHTQRFRKADDAPGGGNRGPRGSQRPGDAPSAPAASAATPAGDLVVPAVFTAPVLGDFQLWVEIVDHNGRRHISPTIVLHSEKELPPPARDKPLTDTIPRRP